MSDPVNHPAHYNSGSVECIDAIQSALTPEEFRGHCRATAIKYLYRAGKKNDENEDVQKAIWYLNKFLES